MTKRLEFMLVAALGVVGVASCSNRDKGASPETTVIQSQVAIATGEILPSPTESTDPMSSSSSNSQVSIPPVTPPPNQPVACSLLSRSALEALGVEDVMPIADDRPNGSPAPSNGCQWVGDPHVNVALYYGRDPLEILAVVRQDLLGGTDVTGIGQDAYYVNGVLFVDAGSQAFAVSGGPTQEQLQTLAQNVLANL